MGKAVKMAPGMLVGMLEKGGGGQESDSDRIQEDSAEEEEEGAEVEIFKLLSFGEEADQEELRQVPEAQRRSPAGKP